MQRDKTSNASAAEKPDREAAIMSKYYDGVEFPFCDEFSKYEKMAKIGQGTFGEVFKAKHRQTGKKVALKKVLMENEKEGAEHTCKITMVINVPLGLSIGPSQSL
ncbi:Cyclin-dependent kinase 9 [Oryzias melastigma]|uniref:Cyclin-dependent kinase 9 n=1 Tax=Oryzias melastigma TaxID=30732 RepID=A0A834C0U0_ORYME|nr:Cyclin-dependent kinase 9 [Oryzias melastigma]